MEIKKSILWLSMIFIIILVGGSYLLSGQDINNNQVTGRATEDNLQVVELWVSNGQYVFEPSSVKKGVPVRLEADISKMPGCSKSVISSELGIRKTFNSNDNTFEFTPNKAGTFYIACSMNMYKGTLTVLESDGTKSNYVQTTPSSGGSCGAGGGGCGCGG